MVYELIDVRFRIFLTRVRMLVETCETSVYAHFRLQLRTMPSWYYSLNAQDLNMKDPPALFRSINQGCMKQGLASLCITGRLCVLSPGLEWGPKGDQGSLWLKQRFDTESLSSFSLPFPSFTPLHILY
jgi:hypothetical protein